jgi:hypothetical protein
MTSVAEQQLSLRITRLLADVRTPVQRWRVTANGMYHGSFPGAKATTEAEARAYAKSLYPQRWNDQTWNVEAVR